MALSPTVKTTLGNMNHVDRTLTVMYVLGVDRPATVVALGKACLKHSWPNLDPKTAKDETLALAILKTIQSQLQHIWVTQETPAVEEAARDIAKAAKKDEIAAALTADAPLPDMPEPVVEEPKK